MPPKNETIPRPARARDYGEWLAGRADWQLFVTLTLKDLGPRGAFDHLGVGGSERYMRKWFRESVDRRARAQGKRAFAVVAKEDHLDRVTPHFHGMIGGLPANVVRQVAIARRTRDRDPRTMWGEWFSEHGRARLETITAATPVATYVAKYVTKDEGKVYALGAWPDGPMLADGSPALGDEWEDRNGDGPRGYAAAAEERWRAICEG